MKKMFSLLLTFALVFTLSTAVTFADNDNKVIFTEENKTANSVDIKISLTTSYSDITSMSLYFDVSKFDTSTTISLKNGKGSLKNLATKNGCVALTFTPSETYAKYVSGDELGVISFSGITDDFTLALAENNQSKRIENIINSSSKDNVITSFGTISADVKMKKGDTISAVAGNVVDGKASFVAPAPVEVPNEGLSVEITNSADTGKTITETIEKSGNILGDGKTKILPIVTYTPSATLGNSTFTMKLGTATYKFTVPAYTVPAE